jgi:hypothetical protein
VKSREPALMTRRRRTGTSELKCAAR